MCVHIKCHFEWLSFFSLSLFLILSFPLSLSVSLIYIAKCLDMCISIGVRITIYRIAFIAIYSQASQYHWCSVFVFRNIKWKHNFAFIPWILNVLWRIDRFDGWFFLHRSLLSLLLNSMQIKHQMMLYIPVRETNLYPLENESILGCYVWREHLLSFSLLLCITPLASQFSFYVLTIPFPPLSVHLKTNSNKTRNLFAIFKNTSPSACGSCACEINKAKHWAKIGRTIYR